MTTPTQGEINHDYFVNVIEQYFELSERWLKHMRVILIVCFFVSLGLYFLGLHKTNIVLDLVMVGLGLNLNTIQTKNIELQVNYSRFKVSGRLNTSALESILRKLENFDEQMVKLAKVIVCDRERLSFAKPRRFGFIAYLWGLYIKVPFK